MKIIGIIPARYGSTRFPGKPLADIHGQSMIMRVWDQAGKSKALSERIVATDDARIFDHLSGQNVRVIMTSPDHPSGTDRCLEALVNSGLDCDAVINIQGDEPFVDPSQIDALAELITHDGVEIATLAKRIDEKSLLFDPNKVKVVFGRDGRAFYFSRQAIPYQKSVDPSEWLDHFSYYKHIGLYAYKTDVLREICLLEPSPLEKAESLEQLRWLENGYRIYVGETHIETPAVDTPEDLRRILDAGV